MPATASVGVRQRLEMEYFEELETAAAEREERVEEDEGIRRRPYTIALFSHCSALFAVGNLFSLSPLASPRD